MSKVELVTFTCPECGWTRKTPFGAEDIAEHTKLHVENTIKTKQQEPG